MTTCFWCFFLIRITRCTLSDISKIIGKGYNLLCFHRYFDVMLFFIGNSQYFCTSSKFPIAVSQLLFSVSGVPWCFFEHKRRRAATFHCQQPKVCECFHKPGFLLTYIYIYLCIFKYIYIYIYLSIFCTARTLRCSIGSLTTFCNINAAPLPRKLHERYCTPLHHTTQHQRSIHFHASYMNVIAPTPPHPTTQHHVASTSTQVTWTLLHTTPPHPTTQHQRSIHFHASYMNVIAPDPTPPHPPAKPHPPRVYIIYIYICTHTHVSYIIH